jgi:hypothetical protein
MNNFSELVENGSMKKNGYVVSSYYSYFLIPTNIIKESLTLDKNTQKIIFILKDKTKLLSKKTIDFNYKKLKVLNVKVNNSSVVIN